MLRSRSSISARTLMVGVLLALVACTGSAFAKGGVTIYAVTTADRLVTFNSASPCTVSTPLKIGGLQTNEQVLGIDFRPATGVLYALGSLKPYLHHQPGDSVCDSGGARRLSRPPSKVARLVLISIQSLT